MQSINGAIFDFCIFTVIYSLVETPVLWYTITQNKGIKMPKNYLKLLDRVLAFAARHTDEHGRIVIDGEIDCKDPGWLVLSAVIRGTEKGWYTGETDCRKYAKLWSLAAANVDDVRSAWTTFCLCYALFLTGGKTGVFYQSFTPSEQTLLDRFLTQLDFQFLRQASKNYQVAAGFIGELMVRLGYRKADDLDLAPEDSIALMLDGYLGDGFFNDDDTRGSNLDRRIDGYSAEIIGLLLHYDEITCGQSRHHQKIGEIVGDWCRSAAWITDDNGEFAKWGRSLRGEAEIKKCMIWEYAIGHGLVDDPGLARRAADLLTGFFTRFGLADDGRIYKDKGRNEGIWDEYTTNVQALGYGAYGLAMAWRFAAKIEVAPTPLPAETTDFVRYFEAPKIIAGNQAASKLAYVIPLSNRFTKPMFFWHNRLTGENDCYVDVSHKFMPMPYFGRLLPAPYSGPEVVFLPMLDISGKRLTPRNFAPGPTGVATTPESVTATQLFEFTPLAQYQSLSDFNVSAQLTARADGIFYQYRFGGKIPADAKIVVYFPIGRGEVAAAGQQARVNLGNTEITVSASCPVVWQTVNGGKSIYGGTARLLAMKLDSVRDFNCQFTYQES